MKTFVPKIRLVAMLAVTGLFSAAVGDAQVLPGSGFGVGTLPGSNTGQTSGAGGRTTLPGTGTQGSITAFPDIDSYLIIPDPTIVPGLRLPFPGTVFLEPFGGSFTTGGALGFDSGISGIGGAATLPGAGGIGTSPGTGVIGLPETGVSRGFPGAIRESAIGTVPGIGSSTSPGALDRSPGNSGAGGFPPGFSGPTGFGGGGR